MTKVSDLQVAQWNIGHGYILRGEVSLATPIKWTCGEPPLTRDILFNDFIDSPPGSAAGLSEGAGLIGGGTD